MISLSELILEGVREDAAQDYLSSLIKGTEWEGKVFVAGGAVRDEILGKDVKDIDIVVTAPDGGIAFSNWLTKKIGKHSDTNPVVFPRFGTAKFNLRGVKHNGVDLSDLDIEAVMTRKEKYIAGSRKPETEFGTLADDAMRRDFTVNSLMKNLSTGEVLDLTGKGIQDIKDGIIRSAIDPNHIFAEDPLRMLRAIRFTARYGWKLPFFMIKAIKDNANYIKDISQERIQDELNKMLVSQAPVKALELMRVTGLMHHVLPELEKLQGVTQNQYHKDDAYYHTLDVIRHTPNDLPTRLAALFHDIGKADTRSEEDGKVHFYKHEMVGEQIARAAMKRLKYPNDIIEKVAASVNHHMRLKPATDTGDKISDKAIRKFQADLGQHLDTILDLIHADNVSHSEAASMPNQITKIRERMAQLNKMADPSKKITLPITGNDIVKSLGLSPGPIVGKLLDAVKDAWMGNPSITKDEALEVVKKEFEESHPHIARNLDQLILNPETGNMIQIRSALGYDKTHPVYRAAISKLK